MDQLLGVGLPRSLVNDFDLNQKSYSNMRKLNFNCYKRSSVVCLSFKRKKASCVKFYIISLFIIIFYLLISILGIKVISFVLLMKLWVLREQGFSLNQFRENPLNYFYNVLFYVNFKNLTIELHILYVLNIHVKFCSNRILFTI